MPHECEQHIHMQRLGFGLRICTRQGRLVEGGKLRRKVRNLHSVTCANRKRFLAEMRWHLTRPRRQRN